VADLEHVEIVQQGVQTWNAWRTQYWHIRPDLREVDLSGHELAEADLHDADLSHATLSRVCLAGADLDGANLQNAHLDQADVRYANFHGVRLDNADLTDIFAEEAIFTDANLQEVKASDAYFLKAKFSGAQLVNVRFTAAGLVEADLRGANLQGADLMSADLRSANLQAASLDDSTLHLAKLWGTFREGWSIRRVACDSACWSEDAVEVTKYAPGEFERCHSDHLTIEFLYKGGITHFELNTLPLLLDRLAVQHRTSSFRLRSIEEAPGSTKVVVVIENANSTDLKRLRQAAADLHSAQMKARENKELAMWYQGQVELLMHRVFPMVLELATMKEIKNFNAPIGTYLEGGANHHVTTNQTVNDLEQLKGLIADVLSRKAEIPVAGNEADALNEILLQLSRKLEEPKPEWAAVREGLGMTRAILEHAAGIVIGHGALPEWLPALVDKLGLAIDAFRS
jgi:uncharacterized protein YjbI with pentapeptide repeats